MWSIVLLLVLVLVICISVLYVTNQRFACYVRKHGRLVKHYTRFESGDASTNMFIKYHGLKKVQEIVDQAVSNLLQEDALKESFSVVGNPGHRSADELKACLDLYFSEALGAPFVYPGKTFTRGVIVNARTMRASHCHLKITQEQFLLFNSVIAKTFTEAGVDDADLAKITPKLNALMTDIVTVV